MYEIYQEAVAEGTTNQLNDQLTSEGISPEGEMQDAILTQQQIEAEAAVGGLQMVATRLEGNGPFYLLE